MQDIPVAYNQELRELFGALATPQQLAELLRIDYLELRRLIYKIPPAQRYQVFEIPKRAGGMRVILAPNKELKNVQGELNRVLQSVYWPKRKIAAHGFLPERSVLTNANLHVSRKYVLNLDLKDFFPSINFGRVRGMFMAKPYNLPAEVATVLAQICCFNNQLPQGAPTSPIVSNMICARLDSELQQLAKNNRCIYTRYADDISFSTHRTHFPAAIAALDPEGHVELGSQLLAIIKTNGFRVNYSKVRLQRPPWRQEVTGLVVNRFPNVERKYVRQIRAMLHAWQKYGYEAAQAEFLDRFDFKHRSIAKSNRLFAQVVKGKIDFLGLVKGKNDQIYIRFVKQLRELESPLQSERENIEEQNDVLSVNHAPLGVKPELEAAHQDDSDPYAKYEMAMLHLRRKIEDIIMPSGPASANIQVGETKHGAIVSRRDLEESYYDMLLLETRLYENIAFARKYIDNENTRSERLRIIDDLNRLSKRTLNITFNELYRGH